MEESKKAAAALQAKDRQASRQMDSEVRPYSRVLAKQCLVSTVTTCLAIINWYTMMQNGSQWLAPLVYFLTGIFLSLGG